MNGILLAVLNACLLLFIQLGVSWLMSRAPSQYFNYFQWVFQKWKWEKDGKIYEHLGIKSWKDKLPDAGGWFKNGRSKKRLRGRSAETLEQFILETKRGELAHWLQILPCLLFFLWNSVLGGWIILIYAFAFNLPFIAVQRYNRMRLSRALERKKNERMENRVGLHKI
ncbi:glycosyl-4,4'-diaponeurosporenoate acyltransferase [Bacillus sp. FJAT-42376]|uniref:glycosyl-4,4'-diaponeurosporenoate acyltransferase CrtO family protein n=1 Tax=Bacillus sp. FJAT-42376 TaxID=2014076 RepID=UPI000F4D59CB|nr:glycosyl-4,4'-diaponeurosporenoate acyltransferase [Bacillus sp. FJAT-42376]AZB42574.1 glycosyl-4,4'-diaponeurosporenoate acyltransferase [Bacillus sp. FJAT-42376]